MNQILNSAYIISYLPNNNLRTVRLNILYKQLNWLLENSNLHIYIYMLKILMLMKLLKMIELNIFLENNYYLNMLEIN